MSMYDIGVVRRKRVTQQSSMMFGQSIAAGGFDAATTQWINAVFAVDSTVVTTPQATLVDNLIVGLKADGLFTKLDRLWLFAIENQTEALVDIVADSLAMAVNSPTFTTDRGFTGDGSTSYIDSNFNPTTAPSPNFVQNSASFFAWSNTSGTNAKPWLAGDNTPGGNTQLTVYFTDTNDYWGCNSANPDSGPGTGATGLYLANRNAASGAGCATWDINGSQSLSSGVSSVGPNNFNFIALGVASGFYGLRQCSCFGFGGSLSGTDRTNIYSRIRTYMSAIGVP